MYARACVRESITESGRKVTGDPARRERLYGQRL